MVQSRDNGQMCEAYHEDGYVVGRFYDQSEWAKLSDFTDTWLYSLFDPWIKGDAVSYPLGEYHKWGEALGVDHANVFRQKNRYRVPPQEILDAIVNDRIDAFLAEIGCTDYTIWDEGVGGLGFRMVRPGRGDGYPMTRKEWGTAPEVVSLWIPIVGISSDQTICLVPGSHLREYDRYMPEGDKYVREYRLANPPAEFELVRPGMACGEAIVYHPRTLHSEEITEGDVTRVNLELRVLPGAQG